MQHFSGPGIKLVCVVFFQLFTKLLNIFLQLLITIQVGQQSISCLACVTEKFIVTPQSTDKVQSSGL